MHEDAHLQKDEMKGHLPDLRDLKQRIRCTGKERNCMDTMVKRFQAVTPDLQAQAGGKGGMLARMFQGGYPVPPGFVIFPAAFEGGRLRQQAWNEIQAALSGLRSQQQGARFAVRSSAAGEDSTSASYAGAFETVLNMQTDQEIQHALATVFKSGQSERVQAYRSAQGVEYAQPIAVVVQVMVPSELAGVLFTADPITGSYTAMVGNYVQGLGEQLVSGEANAAPFRLLRPKGNYDGPEMLRPYAAALYTYAAKLEKELGTPQDIEWTVAKGKVYLLQARPITTLTAGKLDTYAINESLTEDGLWVNTNVGEAIPGVVTPLSWSLIRALDQESTVVPGYYLWSGNICGRIYSNLSQRLSAIKALSGWDTKRGMKSLGEAFGQIPETIDSPIHPFTRGHLLKLYLAKVPHLIRNMLAASKRMPEFLADAPDWCSRMKERLTNTATEPELLAIWREELHPETQKAWWVFMVGGSNGALSLSLRKKLTPLVGLEDANALLSHLRGDAELASLGPVVGIARVIKGKISEQDFVRQYGHRGPYEFELSNPDPVEDPHYLQRQREAYASTEADAEELLLKQQTRYEEAIRRFQQRYPRKSKWLEKQLARASAGARQREATRSEFTRVHRVVRTFALKAGELTGIGQDIFFLYMHEVEDLLAGKTGAIKYIPARKANYETYQALPPFPSIIRGRFDPFTWAKDPERRLDYYDATAPQERQAASDILHLHGYAGAAGRVEGSVRVLHNPEEGAQLQPGEILVATTTNVGWTPLFPKAAAIITDVGAPLSHAAIVARELGIPAVVGCGSATTRLKTGDQVIVDGGQGLVSLAKEASDRV
jgi:phosphohistidine swiveling domain-containing protein